MRRQAVWIICICCYGVLYLLSCVDLVAEFKVSVKEFYLQPVEKEEIPKFLEVVNILFYQQAADSGIVSPSCEIIEVNASTKELIESLKASSFYANWKSQNFLYYITLSESQVPCGYFWYSINEREAFIDVIFIDRNYRKMGIGTTILSTLETYLKQHDFEVIRLHVFTHNEPACNLYRKLGYEVETSYGELSCHMRKNL